MTDQLRAGSISATPRGMRATALKFNNLWRGVLMQTMFNVHSPGTHERIAWTCYGHNGHERRADANVCAREALKAWPLS